MVPRLRSTWYTVAVSDNVGLLSRLARSGGRLRRANPDVESNPRLGRRAGGLIRRRLAARVLLAGSLAVAAAGAATGETPVPLARRPQERRGIAPVTPW